LIADPDPGPDADADPDADPDLADPAAFGGSTFFGGSTD
jgi:hypothetical protein